MLLHRHVPVLRRCDVIGYDLCWSGMAVGSGVSRVAAGRSGALTQVLRHHLYRCTTLSASEWASTGVQCCASPRRSTWTTRRQVYWSTRNEHCRHSFSALGQPSWAVVSVGGLVPAAGVVSSRCHLMNSPCCRYTRTHNTRV